MSLPLIPMVLIISLFIPNFNWMPPEFKDIKKSYKKSDVLLLDRHGLPIEEIRTDQKGRRLNWTAVTDISSAFLKIVVFSEDRHFYTHSGVDYKALIKAVIDTFTKKKRRGASTITMQLAVVLKKDIKGSKKTFARKLAQILAARQIEKLWSKTEILEAYLNLITFRGELQGISAASYGLFGKSPAGLNETESVILASLIVSPNADPQITARRACALSKSMGNNSECTQIETMTKERLSIPYRITPAVSLAPHFARKFLKVSADNLTTSLDANLQRYLIETLNNSIYRLRQRNVKDGAILVVENKTGQILGYVGNSGLSSSARHVDGITAKRQAGSTLKPFLYELAIEKKYLTAASLIEDTPVQLQTISGLYVPENYDNTYRGAVSLRTALSSSINIPAVKTILLTGVEPFYNRLKQLGFDSLTEGADYYGASLALGSADITLMELVNAYRTLANKGIYSKLTMTIDNTSVTGKKIMNERAVFIISSILSDREARSTTFGLENPLSTKFWSAAKTGTSKDMRDNWCVGYSDTYTVGVWIGNFSGEPMRDVTGITGAAPLWLETMTYLHRNNPSKPPAAVSELIQRQVSFSGTSESPLLEWFIKGTEPNTVIAAVKSDSTTQITYPIDGAIFAIDLDIPKDAQRIPFNYKPSGYNFQWVIDRKNTGVFKDVFLWKPTHGKHIVSIANKTGVVVDSVRFVVR
ncbi:penicillin-binding protein 1C [Candidatus Magnetomonas plexicatena]|uniref:penicillin-binding protein 1C n=1 Tax=Candidatus Magnetomonas plexicatena TaxID=2552947 RepID=UPI001C74D482|nr:penicillin-binding protein 1C [Nitrospirales bacterium LBB_01]